MGRMHGIYIHFIFSGVLNFVLTYLLLRVNPFAKTGLFFIFLPFLLLLLPIVQNLYNKVFFPGFIGNLMYLISTFFGFLLFKKFSKKIIYIYIFVYIILVYHFNNINNYYYTSCQPQSTINLNFNNISLTDSQGKKIFLEKNKIYLIDIWALSCSVCIKELPKFKKVESYYKHNKNIQVIAVNISNTENDILKSEEIVKNLNLTNYYTNRDIYQYLNFNTIPKYIIMNKKGEVKYLGLLNIEYNESYNNFYKLVNNELQKL